MIAGVQLKRNLFTATKGNQLDEVRPKTLRDLNKKRAKYAINLTKHAKHINGINDELFSL